MCLSRRSILRRGGVNLKVGRMAAKTGARSFIMQISLLIIKTSVVVHNEKPAPDFPKSLPQGKLGQIRTMMANRPNQQVDKRQKRRIDSCQTLWLFHADRHYPHYN